jgi:hypothetical protein
MFRLHTLTLSSAGLVLLALVNTGTLPAQEVEHDHSHEGHSHAEGVHEGHDHPEIVAFQLKDWHEQHFDDTHKAAQHYQAIKGLGCEVKQSQHDGHTDIVYRCTTWKEMKVANHKLADQWNGWLKGSGFDTHHAHINEAFQHGEETVQLRLVDWQTAHLTGPQLKDSKSFAQSLEDLGCAVNSEAHGDHADITYRCPMWITIHVADHAAAEEWQGWLKGHGFETKHVH